MYTNVGDLAKNRNDKEFLKYKEMNPKQAGPLQRLIQRYYLITTLYAFTSTDRVFFSIFYNYSIIIICLCSRNAHLFRTSFYFFISSTLLTPIQEIAMTTIICWIFSCYCIDIIWYLETCSTDTLLNLFVHLMVNLLR